MKKQKHIIKSQIFEVKVADQLTGQDIHQQLSRLNRDKLIAILDKYCTKLSDPALIHRIEKLELDLGALPRENFEKAFVFQFEKHLKKALEAYLSPFSSKAAREVKLQSCWEGIDHFLTHGVLPWWVGQDAYDFLEKSFEFLGEEQPDLLRARLDPLLTHPASQERIIFNLEDKTLHLFADLVVPGFSSKWPSMERYIPDIITSLPGVSRISTERSRLIRWKAVFFNLKRKIPVEELFRQVLLHLTAQLKIPYADLSDHLKDYTKKIKGGNIIRILQPLIPLSETTLMTLWGPVPIADLNQLLARLKEILPEDKGYLLAKEASLKKSPATKAKSPISKKISFYHQLKKLLSKKISDREKSSQLKELLGDLFSVAFEEKNKEKRFFQKEKEFPLKETFSDSSEIYISNAGLVILWPFLNRLFEIAEWVENGSFIDQELTHKAVVLLQILVDPLTEVKEFMLPLNKLLCGLELSEVVRLEFSFSEEEINACEAFLESVIQRAPILNDMSVQGFRNTFLRRNGILSSRDGNWLLRVERETYDVVLDKIPWSFQFVRLPWMEAPILVEW